MKLSAKNKRGLYNTVRYNGIDKREYENINLGLITIYTNAQTKSAAEDTLFSPISSKTMSTLSPPSLIS